MHEIFSLDEQISSVFYRRRFHVAIIAQEKSKSRDAENLAFKIMKCVYTSELYILIKAVITVFEIRTYRSQFLAHIRY